MNDDDTQPSEMPPQPKTREIPAPRPEEILLAEVRSGFRSVNQRLDTQDATMEKLVTEGIESNVRLTRIEVRVEGAELRVAELESRIGRTSSRVKEVSQQDMAQDAQLAQERAAREALAAKVDAIAKTNETQLAILARLDKVASNPTVKLILFAIGVAVTGWLMSHGIKVPQ